MDDITALLKLSLQRPQFPPYMELVEAVRLRWEGCGSAEASVVGSSLERPGVLYSQHRLRYREAFSRVLTAFHPANTKGKETGNEKKAPVLIYKHRRV